MAAQPPKPPKPGGMSLYANLLNPKADAPSASVSGAPVPYESDDATAKNNINPALRFQPIRRPQVNQKKPTANKLLPKAIPSAHSTEPPQREASSTTATPPPAAAQRSTLADWAADDDDYYLYPGEKKRQRGGRRAARKKQQQQQQQQQQRATDWDEIYDPARPTNVDEYLRSDERVREVQEWKRVLYAHRRGRRGRYGEESSEEDEDEDDEREDVGGGRNHFAPPQDYSFAPPPMSPPPPPNPQRDSPAAAPAPIPDDATGDDAYARRLALSTATQQNTPTPPPPPPQDSTATISRAPVRYEAPPPPQPMDMDMDMDDTPLPDAAADADDEPPPSSNSRLPGQAGFAQRLMSKYGWTAGTGLGAQESGILNPLSVQVEKRRKKPDAQGGGYADPKGGRGKIIGGKLAKKEKHDNDDNNDDNSASSSSSSKFGPMSHVIVLRNMLENMANLQEEIQEGLGQEIGEECGDKYGRVERLYIDVEGRRVFIKFTDAVSALRAVNALEGRVFNGNAIAARFWDADKFERGEYS